MLALPHPLTRRRARNAAAEYPSVLRLGRPQMHGSRRELRGRRARRVPSLVYRRAGAVQPLRRAAGALSTLYTLPCARFTCSCLEQSSLVALHAVSEQRLQSLCVEPSAAPPLARGVASRSDHVVYAAELNASTCTCAVATIHVRPWQMHAQTATLARARAGRPAAVPRRHGGADGRAAAWCRGRGVEAGAPVHDAVGRRRGPAAPGFGGRHCAVQHGAMCIGFGSPPAQCLAHRWLT
jgi:hypothetical protein